MNDAGFQALSLDASLTMQELAFTVSSPRAG